MAGDWIKMRLDLSDDPAVVTMASQLGRSEFEVVGALHRIWCWADRHTTDGTAPGITPVWLDRYIFAGFSKAIEAVGWVRFDAAGITFIGFDRHNGKSAKTRAEGAVRQRLSRENRDNGETGCARTIIPKPIARAVLSRDGYQCVYCGEQSSQEKEAGKRPVLSLDHIIPVSRGGACNMANLVTCCRACNNEKNDRTPAEWGMEPTWLQPGVAYHGEGTGMSQDICDKSVTREEKRREEKDQKLSPPAGDCPHAEILEAYHELLPANPRMKVWAGKRMDSLRSRWREDPKRQTLDYWRRYFAHVAASPFLTGQVAGTNGRPFLPGLDWLVLPENFAKVIEGRYHDRA